MARWLILWCVVDGTLPLRLPSFLWDKVPARRLGILGRAGPLLARLDSPDQRKPQRSCPCPRRASPGHEDENMSCQGGNPIAVWMNILAGRKQDDGAVQEVQ